ncbi:L-arabinose transport system permease protein AraQ [compost metagenome]
MISVLRTVIGTIVTVFSSAMVAYTISRQEYLLRKFVTIAFILTMYINGGLIPNFLLIRDLGLIDSFWVYIWPGLIGVFNLIIIRSFIEGLPESIMESARIDGAGDYRNFFSIVLQLCTPVLATVALFSGVYQWNQWFDVFLYNSSNIDLSTLQYELQKILQNSNASLSAKSAGDAFAGAGQNATAVTPFSVRATMTITASVPIIMVYPFLQKYFVKGMMVGGVKG